MDWRVKTLGSIFEKGALYPVITPSLCIYNPIELVKQIAGYVDIIQLRMKDETDSEKIILAREFRKNFKGILIIDDRADIAILSGADGVHVGQDDLSVSDIRKIDGKLLVGVSTHNPKEIEQAINLEADYINVGPIFPTQTKTNSYKPLGIRYLKSVSQKITIPFSVMGGIKPDNIEQVVGSGARICAVVTAITQATDPAKTTKLLNKKIRSTILPLS